MTDYPTEISASNVIEFPFASGRALARNNVPEADRRMIGAALAERTAAPLSEIGRNERLRRERGDVWRKVSTKLDYWTAWRKLHSEIRRAFDCGILDDLDCPATLLDMHDFEDPYLRVDAEIRHIIQAAEIALLLTPAPDVASLSWKRKTFGKRWYQIEDADAQYLRKHFGDKPTPSRDIEQAMADDEAWLDAHPARQCRANARRRGA